MSLFWRLFLWNGLVLVLATLALAFTPATVSYPIEVREAVVVTVGLSLMLAVNARLVTSALRPLGRLHRAVDGLRNPADATPLPVVRDDEVGRLTAAYNAMLPRLQAERRRATGLALRAQEDERRRVSRELHDGVGQTMTVLLLQLKALAGAVPGEVRGEVEALSEVARGALEEVRAISRELRPGPLEDLGLVPALTHLVREVGSSSGVDVSLDVRDRPDLGAETELVVYRVVQEALTNVARHARATRATVTMEVDGDLLTVRVVDDGVGPGGEPGTGINGMVERARLVHGGLDVVPGPDGGTTVALTVPLTPPPPEDPSPPDARPVFPPIDPDPEATP